MNLSDMLSPSDIFFLEKKISKDEMFREFSNTFFKNKKISNATEVYHLLTEREKLGSTAVGDEVAIPHTKLKSIDNIQILIAIDHEGVECDPPDNLPVKLFFVVLSPEENISDHLKVLAKISKLIKLTDFKKKVLNAKTPEEILDILKEEESKV
jgi:PTS system nitrogen regulatory IIA component